MKNLLVALLFSSLIISCKKEAVEATLRERCATVFVQPQWAKNFTTDSLYSLNSINGALFSRQIPSGPHWDTTYQMGVPIKFRNNGTGLLDNGIFFNYRVVNKYPFPEIIVTNLNDLSAVFPFSNSMVNQSSINMRVEFYSDKGCQLIFSNGIEYPLTTHTYEHTYLFVAK